MLTKAQKAAIRTVIDIISPDINQNQRKDLIIFWFISMRFSEERSDIEQRFLINFNKKNSEDEKEQKNSDIDRYTRAKDQELERMVKATAYRIGDKVQEDDRKMISNLLRKDIDDDYKIQSEDVGIINSNLNPEEILDCMMEYINLQMSNLIRADEKDRKEKKVKDDRCLMRDINPYYYDFYYNTILLRYYINTDQVDEAKNGIYERDFLNLRNSDGTPLIRAVDKGFVPVVKKLIDKKVDSDLQNWGGYTAASVAAMKSDSKNSLIMLQELSKAGADFNLQTKSGYSPIMLAVRFGNKEAFKFLLSEAKVNLDVRDKNNHTVLSYAIEKGSKEMVVDLLNAGAKYSSFKVTSDRSLDLTLFTILNGYWKDDKFISSCLFNSVQIDNPELVEHHRNLIESFSNLFKAAQKDFSNYVKSTNELKNTSYLKDKIFFDNVVKNIRTYMDCYKSDTELVDIIAQNICTNCLTDYIVSKGPASIFDIGHVFFKNLKNGKNGLPKFDQIYELNREFAKLTSSDDVAVHKIEEIMKKVEEGKKDIKSRVKIVDGEVKQEIKQGKDFEKKSQIAAKRAKKFGRKTMEQNENNMEQKYAEEKAAEKKAKHQQDNPSSSIADASASVLNIENKNPYLVLN